MRIMKSLFAGIALLLLPAHAFAVPAAGLSERFNLASSTDVVFEGSASYEASGSSVTIEVDRVSNNSADTTSGTLFLTLWATSTSSPIGSGYELANVELGELAPFEYFYDIVQTTTFVAPPDGTYYVHLLLVEYPDTSTIVDHITFGSQVFSGGGGGGGGDDGGGDDGGGDGGTGGTDSGADLSIVGDAYPVYASDGYITLINFPGEMIGTDAVSIINEGASTSGALRARVVASDDRYSGGTLTGYRMADYDLPQPLGAGEHYADFMGQVTPLDSHPAFGEYYVYTLLMERASDGEYYIVDYREWDGLQTVGCGPTADCVGGDDSSSDDGGGGMLHPALLLILAGLGLLAGVARRRRRD
ncbi:MAG TPA: MYXO-CTERM sorting domain-containing protein [Gammaproteobacteria bacterium]